MSPGGRRRAGGAARPRADRGQHLPRASAPTRTASACSAARWPARRWWRRPAPSSPRTARALPPRLLPAARRPDVPILYEVDRIRDGRSFTTRRVVAIQHGKAIFNLQSQLPGARGGARARGPHARRARPETLPDFATRMAPVRRQDGPLVPPAPAHRHALRRRQPARPQGAAAARTSRCGCGPTARCPTTPCCTPAWSPTPVDMTLLDTALRPHGGSWDGRGPDDGEPRPRHVVPPAVPGRRVAALRPGHARRRRAAGASAGATSSPSTGTWRSPSCRRA